MFWLYGSKIWICWQVVFAAYFSSFFHILKRIERVRRRKNMLGERAHHMEQGYKCSRCGGIFEAYGEDTIRCPFCAMLCDEVKCRVIDMDHL